MAKHSDIVEKIKYIPEQPGVYQYIDNHNKIIYVGKAKNLKRRVSSYFQHDRQTIKTRRLVSEICDLRYIVTTSEQDAFLLENNLIKKFQPKYNILLKDGKSYPKILITKENYPRVIKVRNTKKYKGEIFGPFTFGYALDLLLQIIYQLYPLRTCAQVLDKEKIAQHKYKVCLKYHIKKCCGVCEDKISEEEYLKYIEDVKKIIQGDGQVIIHELNQKMRLASEKMEYEQADDLYKKIQLLEKFRSKTIICETNITDLDVFGYEETDETAYISMLKIHNGSIVQGQVIEYKKRNAEKEEILSHAIMELRMLLGSEAKNILVPFMPDFVQENINAKIPQIGDKKQILDIANKTAIEYKNEAVRINDKKNSENKSKRILEKLQQLLQLPTLPNHIESFDISNIQGSNSTGCCVVYKNAKASKKDYKKYIIKTIIGADDYGSTQEIIHRRYSRAIEENTELPNLIIADGGLGQMNAIKKGLHELSLDIPVLGLKKNKHHKTNTLIYGEEAQEISLSPNDELFHFLAQIQDEVHRFTISFHRQKRSKAQVKSELDEIKGIGINTKQLLLKHFKGINKIKNAELKELAEICGNKKAEIIYQHFHGNEA